MNNKIWSKMLLIGLILSTFTVAFSVSAAPGDGFATAITITPGDTTGTLPGPSDALSWYYTFVVGVGQVIFAVSFDGEGRFGRCCGAVFKADKTLICPLCSFATN